MWLEREMMELAEEYSMSFDEVAAIFEQVNCNKQRLRERLQGGSFCSWKKIEDMILKNYYDETKANNGKPPAQLSEPYQLLIEEKGLEEIAARNKFLNLVL